MRGGLVGGLGGRTGRKFKRQDWVRVAARDYQGCGYNRTQVHD